MEYTRPTPGSLFFNEDGIAGCPKCGWRGIPTFTGGRTARMFSILSFGDRLRKDRHPRPADVDHRCPSCESEVGVCAKGHPTLRPGPTDLRRPCGCLLDRVTNRRRPKAPAKRKAAKAARRRNR